MALDDRLTRRQGRHLAKRMTDFGLEHVHDARAEKSRKWRQIDAEVIVDGDQARNGSMQKPKDFLTSHPTSIGRISGTALPA